MHLTAAMRRRLFSAMVAALLATGVAVMAQHLGISAKVLNPISLSLPEQVAFGTLPGPKAPQPKQAAKPPKVTTYEVAEGDTVEAIAARYGLSVNTVLWSNDLGADDVLSIGQELAIPAVDGVVHEVRSGDNLWDIREAYGAEIDMIVHANPDISPDTLQPGQVLLIPGGKPARSRMLASRSGGSRSAAARGTFEYWPATGPVTDPFGWRTHPVYGTRNFHDGLDVGIGTGTPVQAVSAGTVIMAGWYGGYGRAIKVDHGDGIVTQYSHLSSINVSDGESVSAGETIGYSGSTGVSTGPHLHFTVFVHGAPSDPAPWLP